MESPSRDYELFGFGSRIGTCEVALGGSWYWKRLMGEVVWSGGAGDRAETSIDRFQLVCGVLGGESRRCDRGLRVIVVPRWCQEKDFWWFVALSVFRRDCMVGWCRRSG